MYIVWLWLAVEMFFPAQLQKSDFIGKGLAFPILKLNKCCLTCLTSFRIGNWKHKFQQQMAGHLTCWFFQSWALNLLILI